MAAEDSLALNDSHPLSEELSSLRALVTRFQDEAHASSIKLQRHALDTSAASERIAQLEVENTLLTTELSVLRHHPAPVSPTANGNAATADTVAELTLSLRRLNAKLSLTEAALSEHTQALTVANALAAEKTHAAGEAYALAARTRGREEEGRQRIHTLEREVAVAREEARLSDNVVKEYAVLVRRLEGRSPPPSASAAASTTSFATLVDGAAEPKSPGLKSPSRNHDSPLDALAQSKSQLAALAETFATQVAGLESQIGELEGKLAVAEAQLAAQRTLSGELGGALAEAKFGAEQARVDDRSAAGMVERYMKFTQQTTTALHGSLEALRARHAATLATLQAQIGALSRRVRDEEDTTARLRTALDETGRTLLRESVGRRREVALRVRLVGREERVARGLRGAVGRGAVVSMLASVEGGANEDADGSAAGVGAREGGEALAGIVRDVRSVLAMLDSDLELGAASSVDAGLDADSGTNKRDAGAEGRMRVLESAVEMLVGELEGEVRKRIGVGREWVEERTSRGNKPTAAGAIDKKLGSVGGGTEDVVSPVKQEEESKPPMHITLPPPLQSTVHVRSDEEGQELDIPQLELHQPSPRAPPDDSLLLEDYGEEGEEESGHGEEQEGEQREEEMQCEHEDGGEGGAGVAGDGLDGVAGAEKDEGVDAAGVDRDGESKAPDELLEHQAKLVVPEAQEAPIPEVIVPDAGVDAPVAVSDAVPSPAASKTPPPAFPLVTSDAVSFPAASPPPEDEAPASPPASIVVAPPTHPLLADLAEVSKRYDVLQRAFRDCHIALQALREALAAPMTPSSSSAPRDGQSTDTQTRDVLRTTVERLHDYTEDARVELEIRVADERVLARGWETIVLLPGAPSSASSHGGGRDEATEMEAQIAAFVRRDDQAREGFARKLADVEHDIGVVKRVLYAPPSEPAAPVSPLAKSQSTPDREEREGGSGWTSWLSGTRTPPPPSPSYVDAPTFGSVMTSPHLRRSASTALLRRPSLTGREQRNPYESLGLRVAMPAYHGHTSRQEEVGAQVMARQRTVSGVYMLGLGVGAGGRRPSGLGIASPPRVNGKGASAIVSHAGDADVE
ncbi:hypothetical protein C8R43DRAFT_1122982 [Mycena crocata]|nr:hypothetical protein C8R43DRAFT_1122982 [Mycena crocata]